jgi:hypothetical protein
MLKTGEDAGAKLFEIFASIGAPYRCIVLA